MDKKMDVVLYKTNKVVMLDEAYTCYPEMTEGQRKRIKDLYEYGKPIGYKPNTIRQEYRSFEGKGKN